MEGGITLGRRRKLAEEMTHSRPREYDYTPEQKRQNVLDSVAIGGSAVPVLGDLAGLLADAHMYATEPESRTWGNYGLTAAGALPFVPPALAALLAIPAPAWNKAKDVIDVGENPDRRELGKLFRESSDGTLRVMVPKDPAANKYYFWPADDALHADIGVELGLKPSDYRHGIYTMEQFRGSR